jgi:all-trans-retinol 13,14-reductase
MPNTYDAIVIGSGLGGLTAGALAARAGQRVLVLERNHQFGGAATVYQHGALSIEASLHETSDPHHLRDDKHRLFVELGILDDLEFIPLDNFYEVRSAVLGDPFVLPYGFDAAKSALQQRFPQHAKALSKLFDRLQHINTLMVQFNSEHPAHWWWGHAPGMVWRAWPILREAKKSLAEVFDQLFGEDEAVKLALAANLAYYAEDPAQLWWLFYAIAQGSFLDHGGHYLRGGSQSLSNRLVKVIEDANGIAQSGRVVTHILLDAQGRASGVVHENTQGQDSQIDQAPVIFGNAAPAVLAEALPAPMRASFMQPYADKPLSLSLFAISLGLSTHPRQFGVSAYSTFVLPDWMTALAQTREQAALLGAPPGTRMPMLGVVDYSEIDTGLNPQPPYLMSVVGLDRLANWESLTTDDYHQRREQWLDAIIAHLDHTFPGLAGAVMQKEMATARSMHTYLNAPQGALYGFAPTPPTSLRQLTTLRTPKTTIPGLWLASAYAGSGGFTGAMMGGATAARFALRERAQM